MFSPTRFSQKWQRVIRQESRGTLQGRLIKRPYQSFTSPPPSYSFIAILFHYSVLAGEVCSVFAGEVCSVFAGDVGSVLAGEVGSVLAGEVGSVLAGKVGSVFAGAIDLVKPLPYIRVCCRQYREPA